MDFSCSLRWEFSGETGMDLVAQAMHAAHAAKKPPIFGVILSEAKNLSLWWTSSEERFFASLRMAPSTFSDACEACSGCSAGLGCPALGDLLLHGRNPAG
jgi:hypothetical protein